MDKECRRLRPLTPARMWGHLTRKARAVLKSQIAQSTAVMRLVYISRYDVFKDFFRSHTDATQSCTHWDLTVGLVQKSDFVHGTHRFYLPNDIRKWPDGEQI